jgi:hypothetical protein
MLVPADADGDRRRRLRVLCASSLFDFWLDWEPLEQDFRAIGQVAQQIGYRPADVRAIYWREIVPAIMGTWGPMEPSDVTWLEQRIRHPPRIGYWLSWLLRPWWGCVTHEYWRHIARHLYP